MAQMPQHDPFHREVKRLNMAQMLHKKHSLTFFGFLVFLFVVQLDDLHFSCFEIFLASLLEDALKRARKRIIIYKKKELDLPK